MKCPDCGGSEISLRFAVYYEQRVFSFHEDGTPRDVGDWFEVDPDSAQRSSTAAGSDRLVLEKIAARAGALLRAHPDREYACDVCGETFSVRLPITPPPPAVHQPLTTMPTRMTDSSVVLAGIEFPLTMSGGSIAVWSLRQRLAPMSLLAVIGALTERGTPLSDSGIPVGAVRAAVAHVVAVGGPEAVRPARVPWRDTAARASRRWFRRGVASVVGAWRGGTPQPQGMADVLTLIHAIAARGANNGDAYAALQHIEGLAEAALTAVPQRPPA